MRLQIAMVLLAATLTIAPSAMAVHGSPYTAKGLAIDAEGDVHTAIVEWTGWWTRTFKVTITDMTTNQVEVSAEFRGYETWNGPVAFNTEFFAYHGWSLDPAHSFDITGYQIIQIQTAFVTMGYTGYYGDYELVLFV